jgi:hypothetical protein
MPGRPANVIRSGEAPSKNRFSTTHSALSREKFSPDTLPARCRERQIHGENRQPFPIERAPGRARASVAAVGRWVFRRGTISTGKRTLTAEQFSGLLDDLRILHVGTLKDVDGGRQ